MFVVAMLINFDCRFMRAAGLPDALEMILEDHRLGVSAAILLPLCLHSNDTLFSDFCARASGTSRSWR
jgi:hypothetical protein